MDANEKALGVLLQLLKELIVWLATEFPKTNVYRNLERELSELRDQNLGAKDFFLTAALFAPI